VVEEEKWALVTPLSPKRPLPEQVTDKKPVEVTDEELAEIFGTSAE
jgi:hypothetical protein